MRTLPVLASLALVGCSTPTTPPPPAATAAPAPKAVELTSKTTKFVLPDGREMDVNNGEVDWTEYVNAVKATPAVGLDAPPTPIHLVLPTYPLALQAAEIEGAATVEFIIGPDGSVAKMRLVHYTHAEFALAATQAVAQWKFKPAMIKGKPVSLLCRQEIPFELRPARKR